VAQVVELVLQAQSPELKKKKKKEVGPGGKSFGHWGALLGWDLGSFCGS
jgi:hypothetical protein